MLDFRKPKIEDKEKYLAAGMNAHLAKPIKIENIKGILCEYCV